jgi:hypothetical protein
MTTFLAGYLAGLILGFGAGWAIGNRVAIRFVTKVYDLVPKRRI